jgi:16S rRNA (adenine1518-N6/adenine1519-N6)-dimethyltransferase
VGQTLPRIRQLLSQQGLKPKHKWGQNFLHDQNHMDRIVQAADLQPGQLVLEVGAGTGNLTERLLEAEARVLAVELDPELEPILRQRLAPFDRQALWRIGDVLAGKRALSPQVTSGLRELNDPSPATFPEGKNEDDPAVLPAFKLIANLPYNVASPLLSLLAMDYPTMRLAIVMVQREVADRLTAQPGSRGYGPLGILVQAMCEPERLATLSPACFWPQPKVSSAVLRLRRRDHPLTHNPHQLAALVHRLFSKRRKQLGGILRGVELPAGIEPSARPEQLTIQQLVQLAETVET